MKTLLPLAALTVLAACGTKKEEAVDTTPPAFVMDDCALISAIGHQHYKIASSGPTMRIKLNGEGLRWRPGCNWQALGFNFVENTGPESVANTPGLDEVTFDRPRYYNEGVQVRTSIIPASGTAERTLCDLRREQGAWTIASCGPDPRETQPRPPPPSPTDATPDSAVQIPLDANTTSRGTPATIPRADPGSSSIP